MNIFELESYLRESLTQAKAKGIEIQPLAFGDGIHTCCVITNVAQQGSTEMQYEFVSRCCAILNLEPYQKWSLIAGFDDPKDYILNNPYYNLGRKLREEFVE